MEGGTAELATAAFGLAAFACSWLIVGKVRKAMAVVDAERWRTAKNKALRKTNMDSMTWNAWWLKDPENATRWLEEKSGEKLP